MSLRIIRKCSRRIGEESQHNGTDKLTSRQIGQIIRATRVARSKKCLCKSFPKNSSMMNVGFRQTPSFRGLAAASTASSRAKQMNRSSDTAHECVLRSLLFKRGLRFRKNVRALPGKPDIVFSSARIAIFCDGDFWHGREWQRLSRKLRAGTNASYWIPKIKANRSRDRRNSRLLEREGWTVVRIWETDIHNNPEKVARAVEELVRGATGRSERCAKDGS